HMVYLDNASRTAMKGDLTSFYGNAQAHVEAMKAKLKPEQKAITGSIKYRKRTSRTPY
ncbi:putative carboxypeptidase, partial [Burkholderia sp. H160]